MNIEGSSLVDIIIVVVGSIGMLWYYVSLFALGLKPLAKDQPADGFRQFMSLSLTSIGTTLSTFVGMLLGVRAVSHSVQGEVATRAGSQGVTELASTATSHVGQLISGAITSNIQWSAAAVYVLSLVIALVLWYRGGDQTDPAVSNLGKSLLGLVAGALTVVLNLPQ